MTDEEDEQRGPSLAEFQALQKRKGEGEVVADPRPIIPPCTGKCRGKPGLPPTAVQSIRDTGNKTPEGRRIPACICCNNVLHQADEFELAGLIEKGIIDPMARPGSLIAWLDDYCGYNFIAMKAPA